MKTSAEKNMEYAVGKNSKVNTAIMLDTKWKELSEEERYRKLQDWREVMENHMTLRQQEVYNGEITLSCFQACHKIIMEEVQFLAKYCSWKKRNYKLFLSHLDKFTTWMNLIIDDVTAIQPTYKEFGGGY